MDFEGVDQRGNPTARKTPPPSTSPPAKKRAEPTEGKKKVESKEKDRQERIELEKEKFGVQSEINLKQRELERLKKKGARRSGQSGSKHTAMTEEQILRQALTSAHSSLRSPEASSSKKPDKEKEKTVPVSSTATAKEPVRKRTTLLAALPAKPRPPSPDPSKVASGSQGQTGKLDKQPIDAVSRQAKMQKQLEKGVLEFDQMEIEDG